MTKFNRVMFLLVVMILAFAAFIWRVSRHDPIFALIDLGLSWHFGYKVREEMKARSK